MCASPSARDVCLVSEALGHKRARARAYTHTQRTHIFTRSRSLALFRSRALSRSLSLSRARALSLSLPTSPFLSLSFPPSPSRSLTLSSPRFFPLHLLYKFLFLSLLYKWMIGFRLYMGIFSVYTGLFFLLSPFYINERFVSHQYNRNESCHTYLSCCTYE